MGLGIPCLRLGEEVVVAAPVVGEKSHPDRGLAETQILRNRRKRGRRRKMEGLVEIRCHPEEAVEAAVRRVEEKLRLRQELGETLCRQGVDVAPEEASLLRELGETLCRRGGDVAPEEVNQAEESGGTLCRQEVGEDRGAEASFKNRRISVTTPLPPSSRGAYVHRNADSNHPRWHPRRTPGAIPGRI
jgi:hypothetical protein